MVFQAHIDFLEVLLLDIPDESHKALSVILNRNDVTFHVREGLLFLDEPQKQKVGLKVQSISHIKQH